MINFQDSAEPGLREVEGKLLVKLEGDVDLEHCAPIRKLLLGAVAKGKDLLIDLSEVTYLDSSGVASLIEAMQIANKNGTALRLFAASSQVKRVFELARLDKVFPIHADLESALAIRA